jgi:hypothetical protein
MEGGKAMTATEELRRMLDERGIEYSAHEDSWAKETYWIVSHNPYRFSERSEYGTCVLHNITPEQAIAATLGGGECEIVYRDGGWYCTECKEAVGCDDPWCESYINGNVVEMWSFCPACGRRLKR